MTRSLYNKAAGQEWFFGEWQVAMVVVVSGVFICMNWRIENGRENVIITSFWATRWLEDVEVKPIGF